MNLNFKTHFPWPGADGKPEPTHFREQIRNLLYPFPFGGVDAPMPDAAVPRKLHTIRRLKNGKARFREGMTLTFSTGSRFKPERFGEALCTGVQHVRMSALPGSSFGWVHDDLPQQALAAFSLWVQMDGKSISYTDLMDLARNDGFDGIAPFTRWFLLDLMTNGTGEYQLVHWTDLRY